MAKKVIALLGALVVIAGVGVTSNATTNPFSLRMIEQAPSNVQQLSQNVNFKSNVKEAVSFNVTTYRSENSGGYATGYAVGKQNSGFKTNQVTMQDRGVYHSYYVGNSIPKNLTPMTAKLKLKNYSFKQVVMVEGSVGE